MVLIKKRSDTNVINLNPTFILWDYDVNIIIKNYSVYVILILEILFIAFILYYFFSQEIIFIYNYLFGMKLTQQDIDKFKILDTKISKILSSKIYCDNADKMVYNYDGKKYYALSLNGDDISDCSNILSKIINNTNENKNN